MDAFEGRTRLNFAFMHVGAPCCGMNAAARSFVRNCILSGHYPLGVHNGVEGLVSGDIESMSWESVNGWAPMGGALLGTKRTLPTGKFEQGSKYINNLFPGKYFSSEKVGAFRNFEEYFSLVKRTNLFTLEKNVPKKLLITLAPDCETTVREEN